MRRAAWWASAAVVLSMAAAVALAGPGLGGGGLAGGGAVMSASAPLVKTGSTVSIPCAGAGQSGALCDPGSGKLVVDAGFVVLGSKGVTLNTRLDFTGNTAGSNFGLLNTSDKLYFWLSDGATVWVADPAITTVTFNYKLVMVGATYLRSSLFFGASDHIFISVNAPTIASGWGQGATVASNNGTITMRIGVGVADGGAANNSTGVLTMPAATAGWNCICHDVTNSALYICDQTASTTTSASFANYSRTSGLAIAFTDNDSVAISCMGY